MVDALFKAIRFKRVLTQKDNIVYPREFECQTCGNYHEEGNVPPMCENGDGELQEEKE